jgi:hypothetical protein
MKRYCAFKEEPLDLFLIGLLSFIVGFLVRDITISKQILGYYLLGYRDSLAKNEDLISTIKEEILAQYDIERVEKAAVETEEINDPSNR